MDVQCGFFDGQIRLEAFCHKKITCLTLYDGRCRWWEGVKSWSCASSHGLRLEKTFFLFQYNNSTKELSQNEAKKSWFSQFSVVEFIKKLHENMLRNTEGFNSFVTITPVIHDSRVCALLTRQIIQKRWASLWKGLT